MEFKHKPVLLNECIENLNIKKSGIYIDATIGGAGHSYEICRKLDNGMLIGLDQDYDALAASEKKLSSFKNIKLIHSSFSNIKAVLKDLNIKGADGILADLGVSSYQLDKPERGFSYMNDAPLDMRMNKDSSFSAYDVVNNYDAEKLSKIIFEYGEERWAKRIAEFIVKQRNEKPIETTFELVSAIKKAIPKKARSEGHHPAKKTFQAVRIEVNNEIKILAQAVKDMSDVLNEGGRIAVITFHSLEDRIIKNVFRELENPCICPRDFPVCVCGRKPVLKVISRKPIIPSDEEIKENSRARSAKLRVAEKIRSR